MTGAVTHLGVLCQRVMSATTKYGAGLAPDAVTETPDTDRTLLPHSPLLAAETQHKEQPT